MRHLGAVIRSRFETFFLNVFSYAYINKNRALPPYCSGTSSPYFGIFGPQFPQLFQWEEVGRALMICCLSPAESVSSLSPGCTHCLGEWPLKCPGGGRPAGWM